MDIGVAQDDPVPPAGSQSLGLTGSGGVSPQFTWTRFPGPFTRGAPNEGQTFTPPGPQGLAIDNVSMTALPDTDSDGDPDLSDPDDDNDGLPDPAEADLGTSPLLVDSDGDGVPDGEEDADRDHQSNFAEAVLALTDPLDPNSRFIATPSPDPAHPHTTLLTFPSLSGRLYTIERSHDLLTWNFLSRHRGDGTTFTHPVAGDPHEDHNFFRVVLSMR